MKITRRLSQRLLLSLLAVLLPIPALAQAQAVADFTYRYNLDATSLTYCNLTGRSGSPYGTPMDGGPGIKTIGSSTSITELNVGSNPFSLLNVNDLIIVRKPDGTTDKRVIVTRTDAANVVVDTAVNWAQGVVFQWLKTTCGTNDASGWISTGGLSAKNVTFQLEQISGVTGGIDVRWECRSDAIGALPNIIHPGASTDAHCEPGTLLTGFCNFTTAGVTTGRLALAVPRDVVCGAMRVGMKIHTSETADSAEADRERITITLDVAQ